MSAPHQLPPYKGPRGTVFLTENITKVAITRPGEQTLFEEMDQVTSLFKFIGTICDRWTIARPHEYALQFTESIGQLYVTEQNRFDIRNGSILELVNSPERTAKDLMDKLKNGKPKVRIDSLTTLSTLAVDSSFAQEFIKINGLELIMNLVSDRLYEGEPLALTLKTFMALMEHNIVEWNVPKPDFIKKVAKCVDCSETDKASLQTALDILESIVMHSSGMHSVVEQSVTVTNLMPHLESSPDVQKSTIALINALFIKSTDEKRKKIADMLTSKLVRNLILSHVIRGAKPGEEMAKDMCHQLHVLQTLTLNLHQDRMNTLVERNEPNILRAISDLGKVVFEFDFEASPKENAYKKLGFKNLSDPSEDFRQTPPGLLALDNMSYFAKSHNNEYRKVILENSSRGDEHDCPFAQASIVLTNILCSVLKISEPPVDDSTVYYPMFFTHDKPFEEFYCCAMQLLNKTWKEMRATVDDMRKMIKELETSMQEQEASSQSEELTLSTFRSRAVQTTPQVLGVVKEQIVRALEDKPSSFDAFKNKLNRLSFATITKLWELERQNREETEKQAPPVMELRKKVTPELMELIRQQRLNYLVEGTRFTKFNNTNRGIKSGKERYWYWRLDPCHKALHYGDCIDQDILGLEHLPDKVAIVDIKDIFVGKDCIHELTSKHKAKVSSTIFDIVQHSNESYHFQATNERECNMWIDGMNALLDNTLTSPQTKEDLDLLLNMEIKLRLLDIEGLEIPLRPPPIPADPVNHNYACQ